MDIVGAFAWSLDKKKPALRVEGGSGETWLLRPTSAARAPRVRCGDNGHGNAGGDDARGRGTEGCSGSGEAIVTLHGIPKLSFLIEAVNPQSKTSGVFVGKYLRGRAKGYSRDPVLRRGLARLRGVMDAPRSAR